MSIKFEGFDNIHCPICGERPHHCVACHKEQARICMKHCYEKNGCEYQVISGGTAHCHYKEPEMPVQERVNAWINQKKKELPQK